MGPVGLLCFTHHEWKCNEALSVILSPVTSGTDEVTMLKPWKKRISALGLAMSESTPPEGITGEIVVVKDFDDLAKNVKNVRESCLLYVRHCPFYNFKCNISAGDW